MDAFLTADGLIALATLTFLEVVLGVDNVIFISILVGKLPEDQQPRARTLGPGGAMGMRILLLLSLTWIMRLTQPLFTAFGHGFSGRDLILISGGLFLLWKATVEIHDKLEGEEGHGTASVAPSFGAVIGQIMLLDIIFSLDSVITAVGMANDISIMITAVVVAVAIMMFSARADRRLRDAASDGEGARAVVSADDRAGAGQPTASASTSRRATSTSRWASRFSWRRSTCACGRRTAPVQLHDPYAEPKR